MNKKHFYTVVILLAFLAAGIQPAFATIILSSSGWSNPTVGDWDSGTLTGTLTQDVSETIQITDNGITLDGAGGGTVSGVSLGTGVDLSDRQYVTIKNLNVTGCAAGISLNPSGYCNVINSTFSDCQYGIFMQAAGTCTIEGNTLSMNDWGIFIQSGSVNNTVKNNTIQNNDIGISITGVYSSEYVNRIYNNNFINNTSWQAYVTDSGSNANKFNLLEEEGGGNYWSDWCPPDHPDGDGDGFVDSPYPIPFQSGVYDNFPWVVKNGWIEPAVLIGQLVATVESMNLQNGIDNSLDAKLDAAVNALDDVNENNDVAAINSLNAFINAVEAQRDNKITSAQADILIGDATDIITLLGG